MGSPHQKWPVWASCGQVLGKFWMRQGELWANFGMVLWAKLWAIPITNGLLAEGVGDVVGEVVGVTNGEGVGKTAGLAH